MIFIRQLKSSIYYYFIFFLKYKLSIDAKKIFNLSKFIKGKSKKTSKDKIVQNHKGEKNFLNQNGYLIIDSNELQHHTKLTSCLDKLDMISKKYFQYNNNDDQQRPIIRISKTNQLVKEKEIMEFVLSDFITELVNQYLIEQSFLTNCSLGFSPNIKNFNNSSQKFHQDHEDYKQIKGFLFINDVDEDCGPLIILNKNKSKFLKKKYNFKHQIGGGRVSDDIFSNQNIENDLIKCVGKRGTLVLADTSNCFHCGSRLATKPRLVLFFQFITRYANNLPLYEKSSDKIIKNLEPNHIKFNENHKMKFLGY